MNVNKTLFLFIFALGSFSLYGATPESKEGYQRDQTQTVSSKDSSVSREAMEKDNTGLNKDQAVTAQSQANKTESDVEITRKLRQKLMDDDQLSTNAHNIKIITDKGSIILKGPVASKSEKVKIENLARSMAGKKKVYNRLTY